MFKSKSLVTSFALCIMIFELSAQTFNLPEGALVRKIWSNDMYNAFTSLIEFKGKLYCSFREGEHHVFGKNGVTRIISSEDGISWKSAAFLEKDGYDLRDPKLSVTPDGRIMVIMGGSVYKEKDLLGRLSHVSFSDTSGENFSKPQPVIISDDVRTNTDWLWRVTWYNDTGYGVTYRLEENDWSIVLLKTLDGMHYDLVTHLMREGKPNETTVRVMPDGEMLLMVRREGDDKKGIWGRSMPPYKNWNWEEMDIRLGGPDFIALENDLIIAGTRFYGQNATCTALFSSDRAGNFEKVLVLPSGGDNSYPGFVIRNNKLFVSYYSSHEGKASIYLAEIPLTFFNKK